MFLDDPHGTSDEPLTKGQRRGVIGFALFFYGCLVADMVQDFSVIKLGAVFFVASYPFLVALHEFGHAVMARALGWGVKEIVVGYGRW